MTRTMPVEEAASHLDDIVSNLQPGDEVAVTARNGRVVRIIPDSGAKPIRHRQGGAGKGRLIILQEDDEHLADFREYME